MENLTCPVPTLGDAPATFASALQFFATATCMINEGWPKQATVTNGEWFDFIIVGAGSAGSVLANRLSDDGTRTVLLCEAGGNPPQETIIPYFATKLLKPNECIWQFKTQYDARLRQGYQDNPVYLPRGKMLGGCSSINDMLYLRGSTKDYQTWYDLGNKDWHPDVVKRYFKKMEHLMNPFLLSKPKISEFYGRKGPLIVDLYNSTLREYTTGVLSAYDEIGIKKVVDLNSADILGSGIYTVSVNNGQRESAAAAFLIPAGCRNNLKVLKKTLVSKILIDIITKTAYGVEAEIDGKKVQFYANFDVIVSAGTINTPQLLMLSGIGDRKVLQKHKIDVVIDLPGVGQNLQDHAGVPVTIFGDEPAPLTPSEKAYGPVRYLLDRTGYLADSEFGDVAAFYSDDENPNYPTYENLLVLYRRNDNNSLAFIGSYTQSVLQPLLETSATKALYLFITFVVRPQSRGYITLKSSDPKEPPLIYANYFKEPKDLDDTAFALKRVSKIENTTYFNSINGTLVRMNLKLCNAFELDSTEYWKCIAVDFVNSLYHLVGTAKMGTKSDKTAVVDSHLRVHGVNALRVIDASVMPIITSCNTNGPTMMIAERAFGLMQEDLANYEEIARIKRFIKLNIEARANC